MFYSSSVVCNIVLQTRFRLRPTTVLVQKRNTSDDTNRRGRGSIRWKQTAHPQRVTIGIILDRVCVKRGGGRSGHQTNVMLYRVTQQVQNLGCVDFDLGSSLVDGTVATALARRLKKSKSTQTDSQTCWVTLYFSFLQVLADGGW